MLLVAAGACLWIPGEEMREREGVVEGGGEGDGDGDSDADADADGDSGEGVDGDGDGYSVEGGDCDDGDAAVFPGAAEVCDGVDNDCDGFGPAGCGRYGEVDLESAAATVIAEDHDDAGGALAMVDLDGDGHLDLAVGAWSMDGAQPRAGGVHLFRGPLAPGEYSASAAAGRAAGEVTGDYAAYVYRAADTDGDGRDELLVAAPYNDQGQENAGKVYLLQDFPASGSLLADVAAAELLGSAAYGWVGFGLAAPGDLDGDGVGEVIWGADGGGESMHIGLVTGPLGGKYWTDEPYASVRWDGGFSPLNGLAGLGDTDGDGVAEWFVAVGADSAVYAWNGIPVSDSLADADASVTLVAEALEQRAGVQVFGGQGGDADGDGYGDAVLAHGGVVGAATVPSVSFLVSGPVADGRARTTDDAVATFSVREGGGVQHISISGDLDGDGRADVAVTGPLAANATDYASLALWYGPAAGSHVLDEADLLLVPPVDRGVGAFDYIGDLSGDSLADVIVSTTGTGVFFRTHLIEGVGL